MRGSNAQAAAEASRLLRQERAELKRLIKGRHLALRDVVLYPQNATEGVLLFELAQWQPGFGLARLRDLNKRAIAARVNLAATLGEAPPSAREWLALEMNR